MKKSFPPFYMNVKHVLFTTSATRFDLFEEIVTLVVYQNECREVFYFDLPDCFHAHHEPPRLKVIYSKATRYYGDGAVRLPT